MKNVMKTMTFLGMILFLIGGGTAGCKEKSEEVRENEKAILGKYLNQDNYDEYIELKDGGIAYVRERAWDIYDKMAGVKQKSAPGDEYSETVYKWRIEDNELLLIDPFGDIDRCKLKGNTIIDSDGEVWLRHGEIREISKAPIKKISKSLVPGKYILEGVNITKNIPGKAMPGFEIFKENGTIIHILSGKYEIERNQIKFYEGDEEVGGGWISDDTIKYSPVKYDVYTSVKKEGAEMIKTLEVSVPVEKPSLGSGVRRRELGRETRQPRSIREQDREYNEQVQVTPVTELKKIIVWSDYISPENKSFTLKLQKDGAFLMSSSEGKWQIKNGSMEIYEGNVQVLSGGRVEGNTIVFERFKEGERIMRRFVKQNDKDTIPDSTSQLPLSATLGLEEKEKLGQQINTKSEAYSNKDSFPLPPISLALRTTVPDLVEKVETIYFTALDYQFFSLRSLRFARDFLNEGEVAKSKKYIEKADRYYKLATSLQRDSFSILDSTYSAAQWMVVYKASRTALGFTATGLGIGASTLFDLGTLYTDYSLDKSTMPLEEAKKNLITKAISNVLLRFTGTSDLVGDAVKQGWGSSQAFPVLQKIMGSSEFKDAVLKEFMRLGGDVGDYAAKKTIEETLERVLRGVNGEKANSTI